MVYIIVINYLTVIKIEISHSNLFISILSYLTVCENNENFKDNTPKVRAEKAFVVKFWQRTRRSAETNRDSECQTAK